MWNCLWGTHSRQSTTLCSVGSIISQHGQTQNGRLKFRAHPLYRILLNLILTMYGLGPHDEV